MNNTNSKKEVRPVAANLARELDKAEVKAVNGGIPGGWTSAGNDTPERVR
jgi:hypothetical protein